MFLLTMTLTIAAEALDSPDARRLVAELDAEMGTRYTPAQMFGRNLRPEHLEAGAGTFVVARVDGKAIGCGAVRQAHASPRPGGGRLVGG